MKTTTILFSISGQAASIERICGHFRESLEIKQVATYTIQGGYATITSLAPLYSTRLSIPLPLVVEVRDLGSGWIREIDYNADTNTASPCRCPNDAWANRRQRQALPTPQQTLMADYIGLL